MKNDGIHMPELPEPTLDELERLAEAIGERVLTVVYILLFPLFQYVIIESCVLRNGLSVRG